MAHMNEMCRSRVFETLLLLFLSCGTPGNTVKDVCKSGKVQSPVNIKIGDTKGCDSNFKPLVLSYKPTATASVTNTGHTVKIAVPDSVSTKFTAKGGPLKGEYVLAQVHFHWGKNDKEGSEHTVDGKRYSMETHVVHYKKAYGTFEAALEHHDGLAVIAFFLEAPSPENNALKPLIEVVRSFADNETTLTLNTKDAFDWFLKAAAKGTDYFAYDGSLTTPPCAEVVSWIVFKAPLNISSKQLEVFRKLQLNGEDLTPNFRKTYPLNGRKICRSASSQISTFIGLLYISVAFVLCFGKDSSLL